MGTVYAIGIDFGTANSCVAYASYLDRGKGEVDPDPQHRPQVIPFFNRDTVPTAMHLGDGQQQTPTFGQAAEERAVVNPQRFYTGFKLHLGRPDTGANAFLLTKYFLSCLRRRVAQYVPLDKAGPGDRIETIVGHPVQWNTDQREATLRAAEEAGFPNVRLEEESLAALYCHIFDERTGFRPKPGSHVLTIDMGGGTTDFAFLQMPDNPNKRPVSIPVRPTPEGPRSYGGRDLDLLLFSHLSRDWDPDIVRTHSRVLLREIRLFKEAFSQNIADGALGYEKAILLGDKPVRVRLTRAEFEEVAANCISFYEVLVRGALDEARLRPEDVSQLILTGGHSRWYFVERTLGTVFPHLFVGHGTIFRHSHPEQSVARGLAYDPLVRSGRRSFVAPLRRAVNPVWLYIPGSAPTNGATKPANGPANATPEPVLMIQRGQLLPYRTQAPLSFRVEQLTSDVHETKVKIQFLTGNERSPLADRVATFQRGFWEQCVKSVTRRLPWGGQKPDRFDVAVHFHVDEHELITAGMEVIRFLGDKAVDVQRQKLKLDVGAAQSRDTLGT